MSELASEPEQTTCWWHPDRPTGLRCTRCERYACPDCLQEASVGYQCHDCIAAGRKQQREKAAVHRKSGFGYRTVAGARMSAQSVVTPVLIAVNVVVFGVTAAQAQDPIHNEVSQLFVDGRLWPLIVAAGQWWRIVASGFLHFGPFHLALNMLALWIIGRDLELLLGKLRFTALYGLSLLGGSVAVFAFGTVDRATVGASGAVYGLLGAILVAVMRLKLNVTPIVVIIAFNLWISITIPQISLLGHLGGLVVGALIAVAMVYAPARLRTPIQVGSVVAVAAALVAVFLVRDGQLGEWECNEAGTSCREVAAPHELSTGLIHSGDKVTSV